MKKYKYTGKDNFFISNGDVVCGHITTWSIKTFEGIEEIGVLYIEGAGFKGEDMPINSNDLIEIE